MCALPKEPLQNTRVNLVMQRVCPTMQLVVFVGMQGSLNKIKAAVDILGQAPPQENEVIGINSHSPVPLRVAPHVCGMAKASPAEVPTLGRAGGR